MKFNIVLAFIFLIACNADHRGQNINSSGNSMKKILPPPNYEWLIEDRNSFGEFIQNIALKPNGSKILDYKGTPISNQSEHVAVLNYDVGPKDLQQCADAIIRIRAEYLFAKKRYDEIAFHFTSGHLFKWNDYKKGIRPEVQK